MPNPALWRSLSEATKAANESGEALAQAAAPQAPTVMVTQNGDVTTAPIEAQLLEGQALAAQVQVMPRPRVGEIILLSLIALGEGGPGQAGPIVLSQVMHSLSVIGLDAEVRALALEAVVAAGL